MPSFPYVVYLALVLQSSRWSTVRLHGPYRLICRTATESNGSVQSPEHQAHDDIWNGAEASSYVSSGVVGSVRTWIGLLHRKLTKKDKKRIKRNAKNAKHQMVTKKTLPEGKVSVPGAQLLQV